jgi:hypothetical protein
MSLPVSLHPPFHLANAMKTIIPSAARPSFSRPAAFRHLFPEGLALSGIPILNAIL